MALFKVLCCLVLLFWDSVPAQEHLNERLDCVLAEIGISESECKQRGCVWDIANEDHIPFCYLDKKLVGYTVSHQTAHSNGFESTLTLKPTATKTTPSVQQISSLKLSTIYVTENILRIKIEDAQHARYEVPIQNLFNIPTSTPASTKYEVSLGGDFNLVVTRKGTQTKLLDTSIGGLVYSDQFIQFASYLASKDVYGFGENYHVSFKRDFEYRTLPIFARDHGVGDSEVNYYGHHPFFTVVEKDGSAHGVFLLNSNAMSYTLLPAPAINLKIVGGILDLFVFVGDSPEHVVQLYTSVIGRPAMPPFWGLGYQQCRWGYQKTDDIRKVVKRNLDRNVPLDNLYLDIDYMDEYRDFTYSKAHFADLPEYINETKSRHNLRWTIILDPAIQVHSYFAFDEGYKQDVFIHWPKELVNSNRIGHPQNAPMDKGVLYGHVWPKGPAAFPDFLKNRTVNWWKDMIKRLHNELKFDALWIDMNEPSNDVKADFYKCPADKYQFVRPQMKFPNPLSESTICMSALQGEQDQFVHYNVHSLYGWSESRATIAAIHEATGKRGFALSRSTFASSGVYAAHWLGDNGASWEQLRQSIIGMMEFSLFGMSFTGADICGFFGTPTPELCRRWYQLGAYYPFSRSHNMLNSPDQDPAYWAEIGHAEVTKAAVDALRTRYQLLHYLYTCFYRAHVNGDTVLRPVHHAFPQDSGARSVDQQFFLGSSIMVNPFLYPSQTFQKAYVPENSEWYRMVGHEFVEKVHATSGFVYISDEDSHRPLLFRAGSIVPIVAEHNLPKVVNTANLRQVPIELWVLPTSSGIAHGELFYDDGESIETVQTGNYNYYQFKLDKCHLTIEWTHFGHQAQVGGHDQLRIDSIHIALSSTKNINSDSLRVTLYGKDSTGLKANVAHSSVHISLVEHIDLLKRNVKVSIAFSNKDNGECITH